MELGEATKETLAPSNKNLSNSSGPFHSAIQEAKGLQSHLEGLERELRAAKEVHGSANGPESESGESAAELLSFILHSPGQVSPII